MVKTQTSERKPVVFFVDDEDGIRRVTSRLLRKRGFEMIEVERVEPLTLIRDVFARSVLRLALGIHGRWIFMGVGSS